MKFKQGPSLQIKDWISPPQVDVTKVSTPSEQYERIQERVKRVREQMGSSYLCHEQNRVRRIEPKAAPTLSETIRASIRRTKDEASGP